MKPHNKRAQHLLCRWINIHFCFRVYCRCLKKGCCYQLCGFKLGFLSQKSSFSEHLLSLRVLSLTAEKSLRKCTQIASTLWRQHVKHAEILQLNDTQFYFKYENMEEQMTQHQQISISFLDFIYLSNWTTESPKPASVKFNPSRNIKQTRRNLWVSCVLLTLLISKHINEMLQFVLLTIEISKHEDLPEGPL